jgi:hypothetical protein
LSVPDHSPASAACTFPVVSGLGQRVGHLGGARSTTWGSSVPTVTDAREPSATAIAMPFGYCFTAKGNSGRMA